MTVELLLTLIFLHWISDFVLQSDWMAQNKSSSQKALIVHIFVYSIGFAVCFGWFYALINGLLHFVIDFFTSRKTKRLWKEKKVHDFFVTVGLDQALHMACLIVTASYLNVPGVYF